MKREIKNNKTKKALRRRSTLKNPRVQREIDEKQQNEKGITTQKYTQVVTNR